MQSENLLRSDYGGYDSDDSGSGRASVGVMSHQGLTSGMPPHPAAAAAAVHHMQGGPGAGMMHPAHAAHAALMGASAAGVAGMTPASAAASAAAAAAYYQHHPAMHHNVSVSTHRMDNLSIACMTQKPKKSF